MGYFESYLIGVLALFAGGALLSIWVVWWQSVLGVEHDADEIHFVTTTDRWRLELYRYRPATRRYREPVILCHGLGANHFNLAYPGRHSLARKLADAGFEVYAVDLRGRMLSIGRTLFGKRGRDWNFDSYAHLDLPAIIDYVNAQGGNSGVYWAGHSMGGMVIYAHLQTNPGSPVKGIVTIGSPVTFTPQYYLRPLKWGALLLWFLPTLPQKLLSVLISPLVGHTRLSILRFFANTANMDPPVQRRLMANVIDDIPHGVGLQFAMWLGKDGYGSADGRQSYTEGLPRITVPALVVAGTADLLAPPAAVRPAFEHLGSTDKTWLLAGTSEPGFTADYGHGDLVFGRRAPEEILERCAAWLRERATALTAEAEARQAA